MSVTRCRFLLPLPLLLASTFAIGQDAGDAPPVPKTYNQIVRLSYVEGDVRLNRGAAAEKATGAEWEKAAANVPLETGYSLVTGTGRTEVEFEDASTAYLGENSVLVFNELSVTEGIPQTELALLSGTVTLNVRPIFMDEQYLLKTPDDAIHITYPQRTVVRVNSYLDAVALTPQEDATVHAGSGIVPEKKGQTTVYRNGKPMQDAKLTSGILYEEWDKWVADRVATRNLELARVMKDSGLKAPIPGMAEMNGRGRFIPCVPYGTCWEPNDGWLSAQMAERHPVAESGQGPNVSLVSAQSAVAQMLLSDQEVFPCAPAVDYDYMRDPISGRLRLIHTNMLDTLGYWERDPYLWAVCHSGSWINRNHRYLWVAGERRHHHGPVRWIKLGHGNGYVPVHPRDVAGKTPVNAKYGVFSAVDHKGMTIERVNFRIGEPVKVLESAPKEFRKETFVPLPRAEAPHPVARLVEGAAVPQGHPVALAGAPLSFDHKSQSFMMARQIEHEGHVSTHMMAFEGRAGNLQSRTGAEMGRGGGWSAGRGSSESRGNSGGASYSHASASSSHASFSGGGGGGGASHGAGGSSSGGAHK